jgi:hypothetical protein
MNATTETVLARAHTSASDVFAMLSPGQAVKTFDQASMIELVTLGRMFWAAINSRPGCDGPFDEETSETREAEMAVLADFDDEISIRIIERAPKDVAERSVKASYLIARIRSESMSQAAEDMAQRWIENAAVGLV